MLVNKVNLINFSGGSKSQNTSKNGVLQVILPATPLKHDSFTKNLQNKSSSCSDGIAFKSLYLPRIFDDEFFGLIKNNPKIKTLLAPEVLENMTGSNAFATLWSLQIKNKELQKALTEVKNEYVDLNVPKLMKSDDILLIDDLAALRLAKKKQSSYQSYLEEHPNDKTLKRKLASAAEELERAYSVVLERMFRLKSA